jgi:hypothetical protein
MSIDAESVPGPPVFVAVVGVPAFFEMLNVLTPSHDAVQYSQVLAVDVADDVTPTVALPLVMPVNAVVSEAVLILHKDHGRMNPE